MDLHRPGRKIDTVSKITSCEKSRRSVNSANKVIFLSFLSFPAFERRRRFNGFLFDRRNISIINLWAWGGGQFHIANDVDVWGSDF